MSADIQHDTTLGKIPCTSNHNYCKLESNLYTILCMIKYNFHYNYSDAIQPQT